MVRAWRRSRRVSGVAAWVAATLISANGWAGEIDAPAPDRTHPEFQQRIEREIDRLFDRLQGVLDDLPRYALPEVTEDGDIIIRRLPRDSDRWPAEPRGPDEVLDL